MPSSPSSVIDQYIERFPAETQEILRRLRNLIRATAPEAREALKYGIPTFVLGENLVHFAAFKKHIGFYPTPSAIERFADELRGFPNSKGAIQFPLNRPVPYELIERIVQFRVTEASQRAATPRNTAKSPSRSSASSKSTAEKAEKKPAAKPAPSPKAAAKKRLTTRRAPKK